MTALQIFNAVLTELNKSKAPSLLLEDYNYFLNKAIIQFINKNYNLYEKTQQKTDDLRVLESTVILTPMLVTGELNTLFANTYEVYLPDDYLHILGCVVKYKVLNKIGCYSANDYVEFAAKKLNSDNWSQILNNYYFKPKYKNPYFYINNITTTANYPTIDNQVALTYTKESGKRYGNSSKIRMEIRYGNNSNFQLNKVYVNYLKSPKFIELTQEQIDNITDNSNILEFPDYVINEIINDLITLILENNSNPRLQTHIPISQSIINQ